MDDFVNLPPREKIERIVELQKADERFFSPLLAQGNRLVEAASDDVGHARAVWEFDNDAHWANPTGNLHGGAQAVIFDICTSLVLALIARPGFWMYGGVSRVLSTTYVRPAPSGEAVVIECEVVHAGSRMALVTGKMRRKSDGAIISTCTHNKVNTDPPATSKL